VVIEKSLTIFRVIRIFKHLVRSGKEVFKVEILKREQVIGLTDRLLFCGTADD
jgi:hypothetical protein